MSFTEAQRRIRIRAGLTFPVAHIFDVVLTAFDAQGRQIAQDWISFYPWEIPGRCTFLGVVTPSRNILSANVRLLDCGGGGLNCEESIMNGLAIDDVEFEAESSGPACAMQNGDVNSDRNVDLSDSIAILGNLFLGNPRKLSPLCLSPASACLPDTGSLCEKSDCGAEDGAYATGCPMDGRFVDNGDSTVTDRCTGLMWQKNTADVNGDGQSTDQVSWCDALAYCESLSFAGHGDWRLPNIRELESIVDYGRDPLTIDPAFGAFESPYWSSTSFASGRVSASAWSVTFYEGYVIGGRKLLDNYYVRAVRNAP
jgi:hypothetical protein